MKMLPRICKILQNISWLGHSGISIETGKKKIIIDPYKIRGRLCADIILITHPHYDHCSLEDVSQIKNSSTIILADFKSAANIGCDVRITMPGDKLNIEGITIDAVPAYNVKGKQHPKNNNWMGYILTIEGVRIYHAGDTDVIPEMNDLQVDIAFIPVSGTYVMNAEEAIAAVRKIRPEIAIPIHYDPMLDRHWKIFPGVGTIEDALKFRQGLKGFCETPDFCVVKNEPI